MTVDCQAGHPKGENVPAQAWIQLIIGVGATIGILITWQQKNNADNRSEWWRRTAWAFERTFSDDNAEAELGWKVLEAQFESKLATQSDAKVIQLIAEQTALEPKGEEGGGEDGVEEGGAGGGGEGGTQSEREVGPQGR